MFILQTIQHGFPSVVDVKQIEEEVIEKFISLVVSDIRRNRPWLKNQEQALEWLEDLVETNDAEYMETGLYRCYGTVYKVSEIK